MKNALKEIWSCWTELDRFVAIFSVICIILILSVFCTSCNAQNTPKDIPTMECYDASGEHFDVDRSLPFYASGVIDFIYCTQDGEYIIEYTDDDIFDYENIPMEATCCAYDEEIKYISIFCSEDIFFDYLDWYSGITRYDEEFNAASNKYAIVEDWFEDDDSGYYYYKLVKR